MSSSPLASSRSHSPSHDHRVSLTDRLGSLFNSSPRSSIDRSRPESPLPSTRVQNPAKHGVDNNLAANQSVYQQETREMPTRLASVASSINSTSQNWSSPITRWFTGSGSGLASGAGVAQPPAAAVSETLGKTVHRRYPSDSLLRTESNANTIRPGRRSEELPTVTRRTNEDTGTALQQAISDEVFKIQKPPEARMPDHHHHHKESQLQHSVSLGGRPFRHPILLDNLARASMPTASLSRPLAYSSSLKVQPHLAASPVSMSRSPFSSLTGTLGDNKERSTTMDSLRSLSARDRGIQTSSTSMLPAVGSGVTRWWFQDGNKGAVDEMLKEEDHASTAQEEAEAIRRKYTTPRLPLVFCHGLLGFDSVSLGAGFAPLNITHWRGITEVLEENGIEVLITKVPATSGVEERARVLEEKIAEKYSGREIHLIGHSMGGLDCRYLVSCIRPTAFKVRSVTTIATPHRGSSFADYLLETLGKARIPALVSFLDYLPNGGGDGKAFEGLTLERMKVFNEQVPDVDGVKYFSWGAYFQPGLVDAFKWPHSVILEREGPNDGMVSVSSAKWGKYLGTLEDVSHLDLIGWVNTARYKWAELTGKSLKFKPASFYLEVASTLAEEVEGLKREDDMQDEQREVVFSSSDDEHEAGDGKKVERKSSHDKKQTIVRSPTPPGTLGGGVD